MLYTLPTAHCHSPRLFSALLVTKHLDQWAPSLPLRVFLAVLRLLDHLTLSWMLSILVTQQHNNNKAHLFSI